jgi:hypothetical protein
VNVNVVNADFTLDVALGEIDLLKIENLVHGEYGLKVVLSGFLRGHFR